MKTGPDWLVDVGALMFFRDTEGHVFRAIRVDARTEQGVVRRLRRFSPDSAFTD